MIDICVLNNNKYIPISVLFKNQLAYVIAQEHKNVQPICFKNECPICFYSKFYD